jgi:excisionase family DNA binding protein
VLFSVRQVADQLGVHPETVRRLIHDGRLEAIRVGRVADNGSAPLPLRLDRDRDPDAVVDRLDGFAALGSRWYLTYRHKETADSPVEVFYRGSDDDGATWSDWAPMTDPVPTSGNVAVMPDGRLAWLARDGSYSLWAYPALAGPTDEPPPPDPVVTTVSSPCQGGQVAGLPANFECGRQPTVKLPGTNTFVPLDPSNPLPSGAVVDATGTSVNLTVTADGETPRTGTFSGARFIVLPDAKHAKATVQLTGGQPCSKKSRASTKPKIDGGRRKLWANARGGFTTRGHFLSATELGTRWLTQDGCTSTTVTVVEGAVRVKPNAGRAVIVRAGHTFTAKQAKKTKKARRKKR